MITVKKGILPEFRPRTKRHIQPGVGYSEDMEQLTPELCYKVTGSSTSDEKATFRLGVALSHSEMENMLGGSVSLGGGYELFAAETAADYLRSVRENDYTISLNYFQYTTANVDLEIGNKGEDALTRSGKIFYSNGTNPYFGLMCGDNYISSFEKGALLTMGLNIKFTSPSVKTEFNQKAGASFGDIAKASETVKGIAAQNQLSGSVIIQALQIGGEPNHLSQILNKDSTGDYYAMTCSLQAMDNCVKTANGLLNYAREIFPNQFSFKTNTGIVPLGLSFSQYGSIERLGLTPAVSLVTEEVAQCRDYLTSKLKENEYYQQKLSPFFNGGYPVRLDQGFMVKARSLLSKANGNVKVLMRRHGGAADCFRSPEKCKRVKATIESKLKNITIGDLEFLKVIKEKLVIILAVFYNTGEESGESWEPYGMDSACKKLVGDSKEIEFTLSYLDEYFENKHTFKGFSNNNNSYIGTYCQELFLRPGRSIHKGCNKTTPFPYIKIPSQFFFEQYVSE